MPRQDLLQVRAGTAAAWTSANPTLAVGEPGLETDTLKVKYGDGTTAWNSLSYAGGGGGLAKPLTQTYITIEDLLQDQGSQVAESWYGVIDASDDAAITSGWAVYEFNGTATGVIGDYTLRLKQEEIEVVTPPGNSVEVGRAFSQELLFDKNEIIYATHTVTDNITFDLAASGHLVNQISSARVRVTVDGTDSISFGDGFDFIYGMTNGQILDAGAYEIYFMYVNGSVTVNVPGVSQQTSNLFQLSAPSGFFASADGEEDIDLAWGDVDNETNYQIDVSLTGTGGWTALVSPAANGTSASHSGLTAGSTRFYRIKAVGDGVNYTDSPYSYASATTSSSGDTTAPAFSFSPVDTATGWAINRPIVITADEAMRNTDGTEITNANVASLITLKETDGSGTNIPFSATIDVSKTVITITPTTSYGVSQLVYVAINNVEDSSGNEVTVAESITFTTSDYTLFNGTNNRLIFGDILDSVFAVADTNFELEITVKDMTMVGLRPLIAKYSAPDNQRAFNWRTNDANVYFQWTGTQTGGNSRQVSWSNVLTTGNHVLRLEYDGSVDTNDGLDRVSLYIDDVLQGSKALDNSGGTLQAIANSAAQLSVGAFINSSGNDPLGAYLAAEVKDIVIRSTGGTVDEIDVPVARTGTDVSGNARHGTWV